MRLLESVWNVFSDPLNGIGYSFWSGIGSGSPLLAAVFVFWRHHNCHVYKCPRLSWHPNEEGHPVCRVHHEDHPKRGLLNALRGS